MPVDSMKIRFRKQGGQEWGGVAVGRMGTKKVLVQYQIADGDRERWISTDRVLELEGELEALPRMVPDIERGWDLEEPVLWDGRKDDEKIRGILCSGPSGQYHRPVTKWVEGKEYLVAVRDLRLGHKPAERDERTPGEGRGGRRERSGRPRIFRKPQERRSISFPSTVWAILDARSTSPTRALTEVISEGGEAFENLREAVLESLADRVPAAR